MLWIIIGLLAIIAMVQLFGSDATLRFGGLVMAIGLGILGGEQLWQSGLGFGGLIGGAVAFYLVTSPRVRRLIEKLERR